MDMHSVALSFNNRLSRHRSAAWRYIRGGPGHLVMYTLGRFGAIRSTIAWAYQRRLFRQAAVRTRATASLLEAVDIHHAARTIRKDGYFPGLRLRPEAIAELQRYSATETCFGEENFQFPFSLAERAAAEQHFGRQLKVGRFDEVLQSCPPVQKLAHDPTLLAIARGYLGAEPALLGARMWWSFASEADATAQRSLGQGFHYDIDGYRAVAFFFYLTDVNLSNGPHVLVRGTHREKPLKALVSMYKSRTDEEIAEWYGTERQVVVCGSAGDGFAEDIFCFHKGSHPESGNRLILQLRFGLRNYDGETAVTGY